MLLKLVQEVLPALDFGDTTWEIASRFSNIDVTAEKLAQLLKGNAYLEDLVLKQVHALTKKEPSLEAAIVLLGMQKTRNLVLAARIHRATRGTYPEWKDGKLLMEPKELLKSAVAAEDLLYAMKSKYADTAFFAGMIFDALSELAKAKNDKKLAEYVGLIFAHGLKAAKLGYEIAGGVKNFSYTKLVFPACLLHDVGKAALALCEPDYVRFMEDLEKREFGRGLRLFSERQRFGGEDHAQASFLILRAAPLFRPIEDSALYHHEPYLMSGNPGMKDLASVVALASNMARSFRKTTDANDPVLKKWKSGELEGFSLGAKELLAVSAKVSF